jgi:hypothetical protein
MQYSISDIDKKTNVHEGCSILPFTTILIPDRRRPNQAEIPVSIRYDIKHLLEIEQLLCKPLWEVVELGLIQLLGEGDNVTVVSLGVKSPQLIQELLDELNRDEAQRVYRMAHLEIARAIGNDVVYDDEGNPISVTPRKAESYKKADVQDSSAFSQQIKEPDSFAQWYELALRQLFKSDVILPINDLLSLMPIELETYFTAHEARNVYAQQIATLQSWYTANFIGYVWNGKKLPDLTRLLKHIELGSDKQAISKYERSEAQKVIDQNIKDRAAFEEKLQRHQQKQQAKQSEA